MKVTFVRHAKSLNYETNRRQGPDSKLGKLGVKQARLLSKRLIKAMFSEHCVYDLIFTSTWTRALETANILSSKTGLKVVEHPVIHEFLSNNILSNQSLDSPIVKEFNLMAQDNEFNLDWKFRGEGECMRDIISRADRFRKELLERDTKKNYLVVSHGLFITTFVALIILGDNYTDQQFRKTINLIELKNTSITNFEYLESEKKWRLISLNDFSHLEGS